MIYLKKNVSFVCFSCQEKRKCNEVIMEIKVSARFSIFPSFILVRILNELTKHRKTRA